MTYKELSKGFQELRGKFPRRPNVNIRSENSPYGDYIIDCNNVYYGFDAVKCEDGFYLYDSYASKNCIDSYLLDTCELCHESVDSYNCYNGTHIMSCDGCTDCSYCISCMDCQDCFGSVCLSKKSYCFFNKQLTKDAYEKAVAEYQKKKSPEEIMKEVRAMEERMVPKTAIEIFNQNSDALYYSYRNKDAFYLSDTTASENVAYSFNSHRQKDSFDTSYSVENEQCYEVTDSVACSGCFLSKDLVKCINCYFSDDLLNCADCIGCIDLSSKQYCILNKQYTKEEYEKLKKEILSTFHPSMLEA